jgi:outer membrane lipoprotein-sorting protein
MKKIVLVVVMLCTGLVQLEAQNATKAKALLDEVSQKINSYNNIVIDFKNQLKGGGVTQEARGDVTIEKDKYYLNYMGGTQMFDGKKVYTIVPENEEVTIDNQNPDDAGAITPSKMLSFYKEGYNYSWDILQNIKGRKIQYVKLTPIDSKSDIKHILLGIDVKTKHIYNLIQTGNNNTKTTITVNSFKTNQPISKTLFTFNAKKYEDQGYYIVRN